MPAVTLPATGVPRRGTTNCGVTSVPGSCPGTETAEDRRPSMVFWIHPTPIHYSVVSFPLLPITCSVCGVACSSFAHLDIWRHGPSTTSFALPNSSKVHGLLPLLISGGIVPRWTRVLSLDLGLESLYETIVPVCLVCFCVSQVTAQDDEVAVTLPICALPLGPGLTGHGASRPDAGKATGRRLYSQLG